MKKRFISAIVMAFVVATTAMAAPVYISPGIEPGDDYAYGTGRTEEYDIAIKVAKAPGRKVLGVAVPVATTEGLTEPKAFLTEKLKIEKVDNVRQNVVDIEIVDARFENNMLIAEFSTPYELDKDIYVGFSFKVSELNNENRNPVLGKKRFEDAGFFYYNSISQRSWTDGKTYYGAFTPIIGVLTDSDEFSAHDIDIEADGSFYGALNGDFLLPVKFINHGGEAISSLQYEYRCGDNVVNGEWKSEKPLALWYGEQFETALTLPAGKEIGKNNFSIKITGVNGSDNKSASIVENLALNTVSHIPVNRPLVEEFTGLWCGYCTRGIAAMEHMNNNYSDLFVGAAYHRSNGASIDPMHTDEAILPRDPGSYPKCTVNRINLIDPYTGMTREEADATTGNVGFRFLDKWNDTREQFTPADINIVKAEWSDETHTSIAIVTDVEFVYVPSSEYNLTYILTADGVTSPDPVNSPWIQQNNNVNMAIDIPEMEPFSKGTLNMPNLKFNDVALKTTDVKGVDGSLPRKITADTPIRYTYYMDAQSVKGVSDVELIQDRSKLNVIVAIVDKTTGYVLNSFKKRVSEYDAVKVDSTLETESIQSEVYYTLNGVRVSNPEKGIFLKETTFSSGRKEVKKIAK